MATAETSQGARDLPPAMIDTATAAADWQVVWPVALSLLGASLLLMLRGNRHIQPVLAALIVIAIIVSNILLLSRVLEDGPIAMTMGRWLPPFGISFAVDALGALFALTSAVIALLVILFAPAEMERRAVSFGYYPLVLLLLCGVSGSFLTSDMFNLYVWFEVMLIASFGLLILGGRRTQLDGALKYGFLNFMATTFFLAAIAYLYGLTGSLNMADLATRTSEAPLPALIAVATLFVLAFGIKAAAFPANAWLPASYHTPSVSVSAIFGGLLTKVGAYALIRVLLVVMPDAGERLLPLVAAIAVATLIVAPLGALAQTNLRRAVGFFVIGGIGMILAGLVIGNESGLAGGTVYAVHSMLSVTAMYLAAGLVERMTSAHDTRFMGGIYTKAPALSVVFIILVFAVAGMPPFLGLWSKILLLQGGVAAGAWVVVAAILLNAILTLIAAGRLWTHVFWRVGHEGEMSERPNPDLRALTRGETRYGLGALVVLTLIIVGLGLFPNGLIAAGQAAAGDLLNPQDYIDAVFAQAGQGGQS